MASCEYYIELLSVELDGQLSREQEQELAQHLLECPGCREIGSRMEAIHGAFAELEEIPAPEGFAEGVMKEIRARENRPKVVPLWKRPVWKGLAGLAACCVLCLGLYQTGMLDKNRVDTEGAGQFAVAQERSAGIGPGGEVGVYALDSAAAPAQIDAGVENTLSVSVTYGSTPAAPMACVLDSGEKLEEFFNQFPEDDHIAEVRQVYQGYDFQTGRILAVVLEETSSSITHQITGVTPEEVTVLRRVPEVCTDDMAAWLILAEVDGDFSGGEALRVVLETE